MEEVEPLTARRPQPRLFQGLGRLLHAVAAFAPPHPNYLAAHGDGRRPLCRVSFKRVAARPLPLPAALSHHRTRGPRLPLDACWTPAVLLARENLLSGVAMHGCACGGGGARRRRGPAAAAAAAACGEGLEAIVEPITRV